MDLSGLPPFKRALVEKALRRGDTAWAERLLAMFAADAPPQEQEEVSPNPPKPEAPKANPQDVLMQWREASRRHALTGEPPTGPAWERAKAQAVQIYRRAGGNLPIWVDTPRYGRKPGAASLILLLLALALYHRTSPKERSMVVFAPIWVLAKLLGVSRDTVERWAREPEVRRWLNHRRFYVSLDAGQRVAGTLWRIRLSPVPEGEEAAGPGREVFELPLRDLEGDIREGLTELQWSERQYKEDPLRKWSLVVVLSRATLSRLKANPLVIYTAALPRRAERDAWVEGLAQALLRWLKDREQNLDWWRKVAWTVLKGLLLGSEAPLRLLERGLLLFHEAAGTVRNPGAFVTAFLRREGFRDLMVWAAGFKAGVRHAA